MMEVPENTKVGRVECPDCGYSLEMKSPPGMLMVGQCQCPKVYGSIAPGASDDD